VLHRRGFEALGDLGKECLALLPVVDEHAHLDEAVRVERQVDFGQDRRREAVVPDRHHRVQVVRLGAERAPLLRGELDHGRQCTAAAVPIIARWRRLRREGADSWSGWSRSRRS